MKDLNWELEVARRKKRWKSKEEELRTGGIDDAHGSSKETFIKADTVGDNIFPVVCEAVEFSDTALEQDFRYLLEDSNYGYI